MNLRAGVATGVAIGAGGYLAARLAGTALRRFRPGRRLVAHYEARLDRAARRLVAKAERGGPLTKAALAGVRALAQGKSPFRALLSFGWTALKETLAGIFGSGKKVKVTNIVEQTDIGAPRRLVYDQWTLFQDFPGFMKKVVSVNQVSDEKVDWKAKIFWSTRTWESTIVEQVPDRHIVWRSTGAKGHVDGTVSFHELAPNMTRVLVVLEYYPRGLFERIGNLWRAQGRRARLELKHFRRHVMTHSILHPDEVRGWRGEIRDSEVVKTHEPEREAATA
ncbi:SRPBCC family protein [Actinomadura viridis]|uniref:SRPBCC family protein n=1 Tax=Actinomadura viridis TaxID=58110 RepID=UPI0036BCC408